MISGKFSAYWIYVVGPLAGASAAVLALRLSPRNVVPLTAKLFHRPGDRSIFMTAGALLPSSGRQQRVQPERV